jgi:hypothetical protein
MGARGRETTIPSSKFATRALREEWLTRVAARQHDLLSLAQLRHAGLAESTVRSRVKASRLFRLRRGVFAIHPPPYSPRQRQMAAVLAAGREALISDWPAAEILEIAPPGHTPSPAIHIAVPGRGGPARDTDLVIHRRGPIDPRDRRSVEGIPVTSADLTLVHLAPQVSDIELEQILVAADSLGLLKRPRLAELIAEREGRPGMSRLASILALPPAEVLSPPELYFVPLYRNAGLPRPVLNHPVRVPGRRKPLKVDAAWPDIRLAFELDTQRFHGDWERAEEDRERDQLLALAAWQCNRFVRRQLDERPAEAAERASRIHELRSQAMR